MKIAMFAHFKEQHGNREIFKSLYGLGGPLSRAVHRLLQFCQKVAQKLPQNPKVAQKLLQN